MRKITCLFVVVLTILITVANVTAADFYKFDWGTPFKKVLKQVDVVKKSDNIILSRGVVAGYNVVIGFAFENHKLVRGSYNFTPKTIGQAVAIFHHAKELLVKKYGDPVDEKVKWFRSINVPGSLTDAFIAEAMRSDEDRIISGEIGKYITWSNKRSIICELIEPTNYIPIIMYYEINYFKKAKKHQPEDNL